MANTINGYRKSVTIDFAGDNNGEVLNKFNWDISFTAPSGVGYFPGELFKYRLISVSGLPDSQDTKIEDVDSPGGFPVIQLSELTREATSISLKFQDYDDNSISKFFTAWTFIQNNPNTKVSSFKRDMICPSAIITQLSTDLKPVKRWSFKNGLLESISTGDGDFSNKKELLGQVEAKIKFEWYDMVYLGYTGKGNEGKGLAGQEINANSLGVRYNI